VVIRKIFSNLARRRWERWGSRRGKSRAGKRPAVDHLSTYEPVPGESWTFEGNTICLNGEPVESFVQREHPDVSQWSQLIDSLQAYRDWAYSNKAPRFQTLAAMTNGVQEHILKELRVLYDTQLGGITLTLGDGQVLLNNVNVRALLAMYHSRPTARARQFLEGMKAKLAMILYRHHSNPQVTRLSGVLQELYRDVCTSLDRETIDTFALPPDSQIVGESPA
jgi:hypothetical protein